MRSTSTDSESGVGSSSVDDGPTLSGISVLVTGGQGLVGSAVCRYLESSGARVIAPTHSDLDLRDSIATETFFTEISPNIVVGCAARVGGIAANIARPVDFLVDNLAIQNSTLLAAANANVTHFVFMASSCIFPRDTPQPMRESQLMTGALEPTNESYAVAKLAGIQLSRALAQEGRLRTTVLIPCNIYGPGDSFNAQRAHVTSALVRKFVDAVDEGIREVVVWGTGEARRELMHSQDLASAVSHVLGSPETPFLANVGTGSDCSIRELAETVAEYAGYTGAIHFDTSFPDGMPQKVLDVSTLKNAGWQAAIHLSAGVRELVDIYRNMPPSLRDR